MIQQQHLPTVTPLFANVLKNPQQKLPKHFALIMPHDRFLIQVNSRSHKP